MGDHDLAIISRIVIFMSSLGFLNFLLPTAFQFITIISLTWLTGGAIAVAVACATAAGIACAVGVGLYTVGTFLSTYFTLSGAGSSMTWISAIILTPISLIIMIFIAKLARGN